MGVRQQQRIEELRAENGRLRAALKELQEAAAQYLGEIERLRRQCEQLSYGPQCPHWPDCNASLGNNNGGLALPRLLNR